ncbi:MAG: PEP/pyruvate-binding domain-containing protein [Candidatus Coproplasma sp.]
MKIFSIGQLPEELYELVGGKARGLDFLKKRGYNVPSGFIVTEIEKADEQLYGAITAAYAALNANKVSVRSSASNEDGADFSNAGQYVTCLDVTRDNLIKSVDECLRSLDSDRARAYAQNIADSDGKASMNLVVQTMIDARCAGVAFTSDPSDGEKMLVESVDGKGENLVSGAFSSYSYSIKKDKFKNPDVDGNLSEGELKELYNQGLEIAKTFGGEVDLEWVIDGEGKLYWLQLRPITTQGDASLDEFDSKNPLNNHMLTTRNIGEMLPGAVTPLSVSTSVLAIDYGIRYMLYKIGAIKSVDARPDYYTALAVNNHLFIDMSALHTMSKRVLGASPAAMNLSIMGEYIEEFPEVEGKNACVFVKLCNMVKFGKYIFSSKKAKAALEQINDRLVIEEKTTPDEQYAEITKKLPAMNNALCCHYVCSSFSGAMNSGLYMTLSKNFKDISQYQSFVSGILSDIDGIESADILASLSSLADAIKRNCTKALSLSDEQLLSYVSDKDNAEVNSLFEEFIRKHGHRSIKEAELRSKAWKNDRKSLVKNLRTVMQNDGTVSAQPFDMDEFLKSYKGKGKGALKFLAPRARQAVVDREYSKSLIIKVIDKFKDAYIRLSEMLVKEGYLADEDSIYFLTNDEIGKLLSGEKTLKRKALSRRAIFGELEELSFEDICIGKPEKIVVSDNQNADSLHGIPVCKGLVYGEARVVRCAADAERLQRGEIMVAPFTDIGWSPYYSLVGALVTEVGSALSHGAVVAREYCLPTVVNVKNATKIIKTGDYVAVNASAGLVSIISEEEYKRKIKGINAA